MLQMRPIRLYIENRKIIFKLLIILRKSSFLRVFHFIGTLMSHSLFVRAVVKPLKLEIKHQKTSSPYSSVGRALGC